jgi:imidazolonepropionase-like amidohydrolase
MNRERSLQSGVREEEDGKGEEVLLIRQAETGRKTEEPGITDRRTKGNTSAQDPAIDRYSMQNEQVGVKKNLNSPIEEREQAVNKYVSRVTMASVGTEHLL